MSVPRLVSVKSIIVIVVSEVLTIQRAGDGRVAQLVIGGASGLDGQLRGPLRGQGGAHALPPVIPGVIVTKHLLLGADHVTRVPGAAGHLVVVRTEVLGADGVTRTGRHLDRSHDRAHVVMVRAELTSVIMRGLRGELGLVTMVTLAPDWADDMRPLGHRVIHGGHGATRHLPGGAHLRVLG